MAGVSSVARRGVANIMAGPLLLGPRPASGHAEGPRGKSAAQVRVSKGSEKRSTELHARPRRPGKT
jgi:hypothetical protein